MINEICKYVNNQGRYNTSDEIIENALWYAISSFIGLTQAKFSNYKDLNINYFGISIAPSSSGKSFSFQEIFKMFNIDEKNYSNYVLKGYDTAMQDLEDGAIIPEITIDSTDVPLRNFLPRDINSNIEGTP